MYVICSSQSVISQFSTTETADCNTTFLCFTGFYVSEQSLGRSSTQFHKNEIIIYIVLFKNHARHNHTHTPTKANQRLNKFRQCQLLQSKLLEVNTDIQKHRYLADRPSSQNWVVYKNHEFFFFF